MFSSIVGLMRHAFNLDIFKSAMRDPNVCRFNHSSSSKCLSLDNETMSLEGYFIFHDTVTNECAHSRKASCTSGESFRKTLVSNEKGLCLKKKEHRDSVFHLSCPKEKMGLKVECC